MPVAVVIGMDRTRSIRHNFLRQLLTGLGVVVSINVAGCCLEKEGTYCIEVDPDEACPSADEALRRLGAEHVEEGSTYYPERTYVVDGEEVTEPAQWCYEASYGVECDAPSGFGRPYLDQGVMRRADTRTATSDRWSSDLSVTTGPCEARAKAWAARGMLEHAAVASLGRFALELMAHGAHPDLITSAHQAAREEMTHAKLCLGLAHAFGGERLEPSPFPFDDGTVKLAKTLTELATRTVLEGCIDETLGVVDLAQQLAECEDAAERQVLSVLLRDERRHAMLAWRTIRWAMHHGGAVVRDVVMSTFNSFGATLAQRPGMFGAKRTWRDVIEPCVRAL